MADEADAMALEAGVAVAAELARDTMTLTSTVKVPPDTSVPVICTTIV